MLPSNPAMLLSFVNMKLRDEFDSLERLCDILDVSEEEIVSKLKSINYEYDPNTNQFK